MKIIANLIDKEEQRIAIVDDHGKMFDFFIEHGFDAQHTGEIYKAKVENVLQGINAAFVNLGNDKKGFLYLADAHGTEIKPGMDIVVQITKNARKGKSARVTPKISIAGRYLVFVPNGKHTGISKKIEDECERDRLREIVKYHKPEDCGIIIRTAAIGVSEEALSADIKEMAEQWEQIKSDANAAVAPMLIYKEPELFEKILRDELTENIDEIVVDTDEDYETAKNFVGKFMPKSEVDVTRYDGKSALFEVYNLETQISALKERRVWLTSGAYLVIDQTEALTVIDVNTGKFVGNKNLEDTVYKTNLEAAKEIARQLRLRALGGIVIIDFIDMNGEERNRELVNELERELKGDKCKAKVFGVTGLGLVQITRKRARLDMRSELMRGCPFCETRGVVEKEENIAMCIKRFIRKICANTKSDAIIIECYTDIARYISDTVLPLWEEEFEKIILLRGRSEFAWNKYRLDFQGSRAEAESRIETLKKEEGWARVYRTASA